MYIQVGKKQRNISPAVAAASGMILGAAAGAAATMLTDEKKRQMLGKTIKSTTQFAKDKAAHLHLSGFGQGSDDDMAGSAGGEAKKTRKTTAM